MDLDLSLAEYNFSIPWNQVCSRILLFFSDDTLLDEESSINFVL